jgi:hypothetical protein
VHRDRIGADLLRRRVVPFDASTTSHFLPDFLKVSWMPSRRSRSTECRSAAHFNCRRWARS